MPHQDHRYRNTGGGAWQDTLVVTDTQQLPSQTQGNIDILIDLIVVFGGTVGTFGADNTQAGILQLMTAEKEKIALGLCNGPSRFQHFGKIGLQFFIAVNAQIEIAHGCLFVAHIPSPLLQTIFLELVPQAAGTDAQFGGHNAALAAVAVVGGHNGHLLHLLQALACQEPFGLIGAGGTLVELIGQISGTDPFSIGNNARILDGVGQFPDIAREAVGTQQIQCFFTDAANAAGLAAQGFAVADKMLTQQGDILSHELDF